MSKIPQTPLSRTSRLLDLVPYVSAHQGIELKILADVFEVTSNQMVADLTTLWMCGLPGYTPLELMDLSFDSGYVTIHNAQTLSHPRNLTIEESIALLLGLDLVMQSLPDDRKDLKTMATALIDKLSLRANLPSPLRAEPDNDHHIKSTILVAISSKKLLKIKYHSLYSDEITTRDIQPVEIRRENLHDYVWAYCEKAQAFRSFRTDRILDCEQALGARTVMGTTEDKVSTIPYSLKIRTNQREAMERFNLGKAQMSSEVTSHAYSQEWLIRSVMASAGSSELTEPAQIRAEIVASATQILQRYGES